MQINYRKDSVIITVGPPQMGKTDMLRSKFPTGSVVSVTDMNISLTGLHKTTEQNVPLPRNKEELNIVLDIVRARVSQGLLTIVVGIRTSTMMDAVSALANEYQRPVMFMIFETTMSIIERNNSRSKSIRYTHEDLRVFMATAETDREHLIKAYPDKCDIVSEKNWDFKPVIRMTDVVNNEAGYFMVMGDLHGNLEAYHHFKDIAAEAKAPVYLIGDIIDYGNKSRELMDEILTNRELCILGNHEKNLVNIRTKGFDVASMATAYTYKELLTNGKRNIEYYINALKRMPRVITISTPDQKYVLSHFTFTFDPGNDGMYQYREQEASGTKYFGYGDGSKAIIPPEYINIYGHLTTVTPSSNQICLNCTQHKEGTEYRAALIKGSDIKVLTYLSKDISRITYPIKRGVDDIVMFPGVINDPEIKMKAQSETSRYVTLEGELIPKDTIYDRLLRTVVILPPMLITGDSSCIPEDTKSIYAIELPNITGICNIAVLPEKNILTSGFMGDSIKDIIGIHQILRNAKPGTTISLGITYDRGVITGVHYLGSAYVNIDSKPDFVLGNVFKSGNGFLASLRSNGVIIPKHHHLKDRFERLDEIPGSIVVECYNDGIIKKFIREDNR